MFPWKVWFLRNGQRNWNGRSTNWHNRQSSSQCLGFVLHMLSMSADFKVTSLLLFRLATYGLAELQMEGDGNCQVGHHTLSY